MVLAGASAVEETETEGTEGSIMSKLCDNCAVEHCADRNRGQVIFCSSHAAKKVQTHADQIRAMSDEELSLMLREKHIPCDYRTNDECRLSYCGCCEVCTMDWLRQPAEVSGDA